MIYLVEKLEKVFAYEIYKIKGIVIASSKREARLKLKNKNHIHTISPSPFYLYGYILVYFWNIIL